MIRTHSYEGQSVDYALIRKKRKTMGIYIDVYGNIELRLPKNTTDEEALALLESKWGWVVRKQQEQKEKTKGFKQKTYEEEEEMLFLGKHYPLEIKVDPTLERVSVELTDSAFIMNIHEQDREQIQKLMTKFYKQQCKRLVEERIRQYQPQFKVKPRKVSIRSNKKHWGSCDSNRELTFNWRLVMAPLEVVDYVVIHEMCHMIHMNHDRSFWRLLGSFMPDYREKQDWLAHSHWQMVV